MAVQKDMFDDFWLDFLSWVVSSRQNSDLSLGVLRSAKHTLRFCSLRAQSQGSEGSLNALGRALPLKGAATFITLTPSNALQQGKIQQLPSSWFHRVFLSISEGPFVFIISLKYLNLPDNPREYYWQSTPLPV